MVEPSKNSNNKVTNKNKAPKQESKPVNNSAKSVKTTEKKQEVKVETPVVETKVETKETPKAEVKTEAKVETPKVEAKTEKVEVKTEAKKQEKVETPVVETKKEETKETKMAENNTDYSVISAQYEGGTNFITSLIDGFKGQLEVAETKGKTKAGEVIGDAFGQSIFGEGAKDGLTYLAGKVCQGYAFGFAPAAAMGGVVRGVYKKVIPSSIISTKETAPAS
ncbi:hypothetical protein ThvES_00012650 [Thiovulum sp. ES]|nr:hypothetical protein ThvES_00012650 [Thiovulum sp. ES]